MRKGAIFQTPYFLPHSGEPTRRLTGPHLRVFPFWWYSLSGRLLLALLGGPGGLLGGGLGLDSQELVVLGHHLSLGTSLDHLSLTGGIGRPELVLLGLGPEDNLVPDTGLVVPLTADLLGGTGVVVDLLFLGRLVEPDIGERLSTLGGELDLGLGLVVGHLADLDLGVGLDELLNHVVAHEELAGLVDLVGLEDILVDGLGDSDGGGRLGLGGLTHFLFLLLGGGLGGLSLGVLNLGGLGGIGLDSGVGLFHLENFLSGFNEWPSLILSLLYQVPFALSRGFVKVFGFFLLASRLVVSPLF